jgi:hypothetical protein
MACGKFKFLLLTFQYLVGWGIFNLDISKNLFRWVHVATYQRRSGAVRHGAEHDSVRHYLAPFR